MHQAWIALILISVGAVARAVPETCPASEDLSKYTGPAYNQGRQLTWCASYTAADELTVAMKKRGLLKSNDRIHPIALAAQHYIDNDRSPSEAAHAGRTTAHRVFQSIDRIKLDGGHLCLERSFGPKTSADHPIFRQSSLAEMQTFRRGLEAREEPRCEIRRGALDVNAELDRAMYTRGLARWQSEIQAKCHQPIPEYYSDFVARPERADALKANQNRQWSAESNEELRSAIDAALDAGQLPGIEYQFGFMLGNGGHGMHWSSIVARRRESNGQCYYKIRNSFGTDCSIYKDRRRCKDGYQWVEREHLLNHVSAVQWLRDVSGG